MYQILLFPISVVILILALVSCAGIDDKPVSDGVPVWQQDAPLFKAWQPPESGGKVSADRAVRELLKQADDFIANNAMEPATDKLERLLRIEPAYALAWSRLAWIALQANAPERSRQLAQRSNSYAAGNFRLKALNWSFIRDAAVLMNDDASVRDAENMIRSLGGEA